MTSVNRHFPRGFRRLGAGLAAAAVTLGLLSAVPGGAAAVAGSGGERLSVRLSLGGGRGPAAVATLGVPVTGVYKLRVRLNGRPVALPPITGTGARRVLNLAELGRLRFGTNRLRVRLLMYGGAVQVVSRTFTLSSRRDIAVARALAPATAGHTVILDARRSLLVRGTGGLATARWRLVRRPARSHARLGSATGPRATLRPDVPGNYVAALRVGTGRATGVDLLNVGATYPEPLVPFNTITRDTATPPNTGIQISGTFYPDPNLSALQVLVLGRGTLGFVSNKGYAADAQGLADMNTFLQGLNPEQLVIVTHPGTDVSPPITDPSLLDNLNKAVGTIGGNLGGQWFFGGSTSAGGCWSGATDHCFQGNDTSWHLQKQFGGSFSIIGVPQMPAGQAWRETAAQNGDVDGRITGYFTKGTIGGQDNGNYSVVSGPDPYVPVQTCASNTSDPDQCAVTVGNSTTGEHTYPRDAAVSNGLHVVVLNRTTLAPITNSTVTTAGQLATALATFSVPAVGHYMASAQPFFDDQRIVIIQSIGNGQLTGTNPYLFQDISQLGGTPDYLWDAIHNGCRYALVGAATDLPWQGTAAESSTAMRHGFESPDCHAQADGAPTGQLDGTLERDRDGLYTPIGANAAGPTNTALLPLVFQEPTPWPYADDTVGLRWVADYLRLCTQGVNPCMYADVRSAYQNQNIPFTAAELDGANCTGGPDVCGPDFDGLKAELKKEFDWVDRVRLFADNLIKPYQQDNPKKALDNVTQDVVNSVHNVPKDEDVTMSWLAVVEGIMTVGQHLAVLGGNPEGAAVFGAVGGAAAAASALVSLPSGSQGGNSVTATADALADQISTQTENYIKWVNRLPDILTYYYGQLSTVGDDIEHNTDNAWGWSGDVTDETIDALDAGDRGSAYSALVPAAWGGYNLMPGPTLTGSNDVTTYTCTQKGDEFHFIVPVQPFKPALSQNQFHAATSVSPSSGQEVDQVWLFANLPTWANDLEPAATLPGTSLTDKIYGPQSTDDQGAYQYGPSWWRSTYNPPGHVACNKSNPSPPYPAGALWSGYDPPPSIKPPLP